MVIKTERRKRRSNHPTNLRRALPLDALLRPAHVHRQLVRKALAHVAVGAPGAVPVPLRLERRVEGVLLEALRLGERDDVGPVVGNQRHALRGVGEAGVEGVDGGGNERRRDRSAHRDDHPAVVGAVVVDALERAQVKRGEQVPGEGGASVHESKANALAAHYFVVVVSTRGGSSEAPP